MPRREVELFVRAVDQATPQLTSIVENLRTFLGQAEQFEQSGAGLDASLRRMAGAFQGLDAAVGGTEQFARFTDQLQRVRGSFGGLDASVANLRGELTGLRDRLAVVNDENSRFVTAVTRAQAAVTEQRGIVSDAARVTKNLADEGSRAARAETDRAAALQRAQAVEQQALATLLARQAALKSAKAELADSEREQEKLNRAIRNTETAIKSEGVALETAGARFKELGADSQVLETSLAEAAQTLRGVMAPVIRELGADAGTLEARFGELRTNVTALGRAANTAVNPSRELRQEFEQSRRVFVATRDAINPLTADIREIEAAFRAAGGDIDLLVQVYERLPGVVNAAKTGFQTLGTAVQRTGQSSARAAMAERDHQRALMGKTTAVTSATRAVRANTAATRQSTGALNQFLGGSRQSLSFFQRLRGELVGLIAAYGGLFAAIQGIRNLLDTVSRLQGIQNRLAAVFEGDFGRVSQEVDFLRRTADRLGISFGVLADEYSKFAVATQGTNLAGERTRRIFVSVAEAARVQNLSLDQIQGTFVALTQIVSKGAVTMEELRRQLGDRLPGAIQIMAEGLGLTTAELIKLVETGSLSSDALSEFADELSRRFGPQLDNSLTTVAASLGRLQNQLFQLFISIGDSGAIAGLSDLFDRLGETISSPDFRSFGATLGAGIETAANALAFLGEQFRAVVVLGLVVVLRRTIPLFAAMGARLRAAGLQMQTFNAIAAGTASPINRAAASATAGATAFTRLRLAMTGLFAGTGVGLAVTAVATFLGLWATRADLATEAMVNHRAAVDAVRNAYEAADGAVERARDSIESLTVAQATSDLRALEVATDSAFRRLDEFSAGGRLRLAVGFGEETERLTGSFRALVGALQSGRLTVDQVRVASDAIAVSFRDSHPAIADYVAEFQTLIANAGELIDGAERQSLVIRALGDDVEDAAEAWRELNNVTAASDIQQQAQALAAYEEAFSDFSRGLPIAAEELERIGRVTAIQQQAARLRDLAEAAGLSVEPIEDLEARILGLEHTGSVLGRVRNEFQAIARFLEEVVDVDTSNLARLAVDIGDGLRTDLGDAVFDSLTRAQQGLLGSIVHEVGDGRLTEEFRRVIRDGVESGSSDGIVEFIRNLPGLANADALADQFGAALFNADAQIADLQRIAAEEERQTERRLRDAERVAEAERRAFERGREATAARLEDLRFETTLIQLRNQGQETLANIIEAQRTARESDSNISEQELADLGARIALNERLTEQGTAQEQQAKQIAEAEQRVNELLSVRSQLQQELELLLDAGIDPERQERLNELIRQMGDDLSIAADEVVRMLEAMDALTPAQEAILSRMRTIQTETTELNTLFGVSQTALERAFAGRAVSAFDSFIDDIAEGRNVFKSLGAAFAQFAADFLRQVAQMIVQQLALNAARQVFNALLGGGGGGGIGGFFSGLFGGGAASAQTGGVVGFGGRPVRLPTAGNAGFGGAFPYLLHRGEEVLRRDDPRNILNGGGNVNVNIVDNVGVDANVSASQNDQGGMDLEIDLDRAVADLVQYGPNTSRALAALGAAPALEGR